MTSSTATFAYDALSRLTNATYNDGRNFAYGYDAVGNRVQQVAGSAFTSPVTTNYTFDPANRLTSDGTKTYAWDANGNMTGDGSRAFTFDSANRLKQLVIGANTYTYGYDGNGNRMSSAVNGGTAIHYQNDNTGLSQVLSDGTNLYIPGLVQSNADGTNAQYFLQDALGSNVMLADSSANWTVLPQYDPFGKSKATSLTKFGYTGEQMDASGLEFLRARYYDTDLGQFISHDPESGSASDPITMNGYAYGSQNPINRTDPSGRCDGDLIWNAQLYLQSCQNDLEQGRQDWNKGGIVNFDQGILDGTGLNRTYDAVGGEYNNISNAAGKFYDNPNLQTYSNLNKTGILAELALFADLSILLPPGESSAEAEVTKAIEPCAIDELMEGMMKAELKDHTFIVYKWMEKLRELGLFERPSGYTEEAYQRAIILHDYIKSVWDEIMWTTDLRDPKISAELKAEVEERIANHAKESAIKLGEKGFGKDSLEYITAMCHHMTSPECIDLLSKPGNESLKSFMTWLSFTDALQANLGNRAYQILDSIEGLEASKQFNLAWDRTSTTRSGQFLAHIDELKKSLPSDYKEIIQIYLGYYSGK